MHAFYHSFVQLLFIGIIALFPVVNPIGSSFIVSPYFANLTRSEKKQAVSKIMICKMGWDFLSSDKENGPSADASTVAESSGYASIQDKLFYPITFPVTAGAGTISVLFTLSAHSASADMTNYLMNTGAILLAIIVMCILVYIFYQNTKTIIDYLGSNGEMIVNRITAFLIFCVGLQIAVTGIKSLFKI